MTSQTFIHDEIELLAFFGVEPVVTTEFGPDYSYRAKVDDYILTFGFNVVTSDCSFQLVAKDSAKPLISICYLNSPGARVVSTRDDEYLEIGGPESAPGCTLDWFVPSSGMRIHLVPNLRFENFIRT